LRWSLTNLSRTISETKQIISMTNLASKHCKACEGGVEPLNNSEVQRYLDVIDPAWSKAGDGSIKRQFSFSNYWQATAFVNAAAWIAHTEDHHPDILLTYKTVDVSWITHAIGGLSENDFICAAKIDQLFDND
jgi:4a-hydroxytetrahydrobiopterin dehydratase